MIVFFLFFLSGEKCNVRSFIIVGRTYGGEEKPVHGFVREYEGKRQLGKPRHRWKVNSNSSQYHPIMFP